MSEALRQSLLVTGVGMAVVFVAMALFYGSMELLAAVFRPRPRDRKVPGAQPLSEDSSSPRLRAAAVAIVLARARQSSKKAWPSTSPQPSSPWGEYHRQRQLGPGRRGRIG